MPFRKLQLLPGVDVERSASFNQTQLTASNLIRFYAGLVQKLGGWQALTAATFVGVCRALHGWADILGNPYMAIGTDQRLQVLIGGAISDITPLETTTNPAVAFSTAAGSNLVTILDGGYSPNATDWINLDTHVSVGGLVLFGFYQVASVTDATHYVITAQASASANVTNGGAVAQYGTTNGFATVDVTLNDHSLSSGGVYTAGVSTTVGGLTISGVYSVTSVTNANIFVITASSAASSTTSAFENAGNAQIEYLIPTGYAVDTAVTGYGIGDYGAGDYGLATSGQVTLPLRQWSLDHWGQDLIASPNNGKIYYWQPPDPSPAIVLSGAAPIFNTAVFVMPQVQIIVAIGSEFSGTQQPLLVRWCNAGDFTDWVASASNQAGSFTIPTGTRLVSGLAVGLGALLWTDVDLWTMTYEGLPFVFGFNRIGTACGIISQRAAGVVGTSVVWLSTRGFFTYTQGGGVSGTECPVWDFLFGNLDALQVDQIHCAVNSLFNEMAWFFPIDPTSSIYSTDAPLGYVKFNYVENVWDYGQSSQYQRTAWVGRSPVGNPTGADTAQLLQQHEVGYDANGAAMIWSWLTGYFDLSDGEDFVFVDMLIPDNITIGEPTIDYTVYTTYYPNMPVSASGPFACTPSTNFVAPRARGRQMAIGATGSDLGTFNRLGALRYRYATDGRS